MADCTEKNHHTPDSKHGQGSGGQSVDQWCPVTSSQLVFEMQHSQSDKVEETMSGVQWKVAPALAAGNCCILKPSELCSLTCLEMAAIAHDVGLPPGVFSVITGTGPDAGAPLRSVEQPLTMMTVRHSA